MRHKKYDFRTAFIDLLINVLTGMVFLFMITTLMIQTKVKEEEKGIKKDAQYIIHIVWPSELNCDVDIWVKDPNRKVVNYQAKDVGIMHIERDDQGWSNDEVRRQGQATQKIQQLDNSETWVLRGKLPGKFTANLHLYSCRIGDEKVPLGGKIDVPVQAELVQLNPNLKKVIQKTYTLTKVWQEITMFNFVLDQNNNVVEITNEPIDLVQEKENP